MQIIRVDENDQGGQWQVGVRLLDFDSKLFGFPVAVLDPFKSAGKNVPLSPTSPVGKSAVEACLAAAAKAGVRQVSVTVMPDDVMGQRVLADCGFHLADTIFAFHLDLDRLQNADGATEAIREGQAADVEVVADISGQCFSNRAYNVNRFNSDPVFPPEKVKRLYETWARNSFTGEAADKVFVYLHNDQVVGFITCSLPKADNGMGAIPLNAVHPDFQGRGIYKRLVNTALRYLAKNGAKTAEIKTQIGNSAVHRTWEGLGGYLAYAYHRFHRSL